MGKNKTTTYKFDPKDFRTPTKSNQEPGHINKNPKRKDISPIDQLNSEKKYRQNTKNIISSPVNPNSNTMPLNESVMSDDTQQSQSILANQLQQDGNAQLQMAQIQMALPQMQSVQYGPPMMGFQQPTQHMQHPPLQQPICSLPDFEIDRIAARLKESFFADLEVIVAQKVNEKTETLTREMDDLRLELTELRGQLHRMSDTQDEAEQYSRRACVRIANFQETPDECTDHIVMEVARQASVDITPNDIDRSHRVNRVNVDPAVPDTRPREIIVKFTSYRSRTLFIKGRKHLRESKSSIFLNEDLTKPRKTLLYECRQLKKDTNSSISQTWSRDGKIFVKDNRDRTSRIMRPFDLEKFRHHQ